MLQNHKMCIIILLSNIFTCVLVIFLTIGLLYPTISGNESQSNSNESQLNSNKSGAVVNNRIGNTRKEQCEPLPPRDNVDDCGNSIADRKCCEYKWAMNYKEQILKNLVCTRKYGFNVIGGTTATPGQFPHMAALGWLVKNETAPTKYKFMCGGSLISEKFVLTAAHCTYYSDKRINVQPKPYLVRLGSDNIKMTGDKNRKDVKIKKIIKHYKYDPLKHYYDIALLELMTVVVFTNKIHPACLSKVDAMPHTSLNITGWGVTKLHDREMSETLKVATVKMIDKNKCHKMLLDNQSYYRNWNKLGSHQLCAGVEAGGVDTCKGDSGGPLQMTTDTKSGSMHTVVGITSLGHYCAVAYSPGIYTSVAKFLPWIEKNVWPEDYVKSRKQPAWKNNYGGWDFT